MVNIVGRLSEKWGKGKSAGKFEAINWLFLIIIFILSRLLNSNSLPLFSDEAYVISKAEDIWKSGELLGTVKLTTQPVLIWLVAIFIKLPLNIVLAGRLVSAILGLIAALAVGWIAGKFIHPQAKWVAFLIIMLLPFSFFYDRTLLFESSLFAFVTLSVGLPLIGLPLAILTKQIGWLALPLSVLIHWRSKKLLITLLLIAVGVPFAIWLIALGSWGEVLKINFTQTGVGLGNIADFKGNLLRAKLWLISYITWPILLLAILGMIKESIFSFKKRVFTPIFIIGLWSLFILFFEAKIAVIFYPRYLYPMVLGIVLLATSTLLWLYNFTKGLKDSFLHVSLCAVALILIFYSSIKFDYILIKSPQYASLALEDRFQFFEDWTSGVGSEQIENEVDNFLNNNVGKLVVYVEGENSYFITLKRKGENYEVRTANWLNDPLRDIPKNVFEEKAEVWFVRNRHPDIPNDWPVSLLIRSRKTSNRYVYLYKIVK